MINSDILSRAALFPARRRDQDGDWLGATLEFDVREGSRDRAAVRAAVSGTNASGVFEGPMGRGHRGSWLVSMRKSYIDWLMREIEPGIDSAIGFTDAQAKFVFDLTSRQQLQFFAIAGDGRVSREAQAGLPNGLQDATRGARSGRWRGGTRILAPSSRSACRSWATISSITASCGSISAEGPRSRRSGAATSSRRSHTAGRSKAARDSKMLAVSQTARKFATVSGGGVRVTAERSASASPTSISGWAQATWRRDKGGLSGGVRATDRSSVTHGAVLPWFLAERTFGSTTLRAGAGQSAQFLDPLIVTVAPTDPVPETATSYDASVDQPIGHGIRVQATGFYRTESDVLRRAGEDRVDPVTGKRIVESTFPVFSPTLTGTSRGVELLIIRRSPTGLSGWVSYTWAHTRHRDELTGENFDGDFDQRHTLNVFAQQRLSYRMTISGKLRIGSNFPLVGYFSGTTDPEALKLSTLRNQVRLPLYARLDIRANRTFTFQRSRLTLFVEVMNLIGRDNWRQVDGSIRANLDAVGYVDRLLPRVPSAGVLFEF